MMRQKFLSVLAGLAILAAIFLLYRVFAHQDPAALADAVTSVSGRTLLITALFAVGSFSAISLLEWLAVRHMRAPVSVRRTVATAVAAIGIGHAVGLAALSSGAIRYRMYGRAGHGIVFVGKVLIFSAISTASGFMGVGGISLIWQADSLAPLLDVSPDVLRTVGGTMLAMLAGYLVLCVFSRGREIGLGRNMRFHVPTGRTAVLQILGANTNVLCIAGALYACSREFTDVTYSMIAALYVSSDMTALIGHVPGGWGLLEYIVTSALGMGVLADVILYRAIYYLVPLLVGLFVFVIDEFLSYRRQDDDIPSQHSVTNAT